MDEQNTPPDNSADLCEAIDVNDFVFAVTGARVRRVTLADGEHWFPAADVARNLGYTNTRQALKTHVVDNWKRTLSEIAQGVYTADTLRKLAGHRLQKSMQMVNLRGLIALVNGCTKPECAPFKEWVCEVVETVQREGVYELEPAPLQPHGGVPSAYLMPEQVVDAIVRLEERSIKADEWLAAAEAERLEEARRTNDLLDGAKQALDGTREVLGRTNDILGRAEDRIGGSLGRIGAELGTAGGLLAESVRAQAATAHALHRIADSLGVIAEHVRGAGSTDPDGSARSAGSEAEAPTVSPQELLALWRARNLVVTEDVHAVAAYLAPLLVRGPATCRLADVASRTGLTAERVHDCVRMLIKRGCMRQTGCAPDGSPVYALI